MSTDLATLDGFHVLRRLVAVIALTAVAVAGLASPVDAACKPTIRQVWIKADHVGYTITTVRAKVARTDHHTPRGVRVCLRMRDINSMEHAELGCRLANRRGVVTFNRADLITQGLQYQIYSSASRRLRAFTGAWWSANKGL